MKIIISLSLLIILFLFEACRQDIPHVTPEVRSITESVYASGIVKAQGQYNVFVAVNGILSKIFVSEGDSVKKGDPLFLVDNQTSLLNTENARLAYQFTEQNLRENSHLLKELEQAVNVARERLELDSSLFVRQEKLWQQRVGTRYEFEQRQLAYKTSESNYLTALSRLRQTRKQLEIENDQAKNNLKINKKIESNHLVRSEIAGKVYEVAREQGEFVTTQQPLAVLGNQDQFVLDLQVDEYDIVKVKTGQKVKISMDSYRGQVFSAVISRVYPLMNERSRTFTVEAAFENPPATLFPNLTAEANIIIEVKDKALIIPREYLFDERFVFISPEERKEVAIGLKDYQFVEILDGISSGQNVYKPF